MKEAFQEWAPVLRLDDAEPFSVIGVCARELGQIGPDLVLEYRVAWSADIGHAYDVETVRVRINRESTHMRSAEGSAHGSWLPLDVPAVNGRIQAFVEPGKHGFAANPDAFSLPNDVIEWFCGEAAGSDGVYRHPLVVQSGLTQLQILRSCASAIREHSFLPRWSFERTVDLRQVPWLEPNEFDELSLSSIRALAKERAPMPLDIRVHDQLLDGGYWWGGQLSFQRGRWQLSDYSVDETFRQAREARTSIVADLPNVDTKALKLLHQEAWPHYLTSRLFLICEPEMVGAVAAVGLIPVPFLAPDGTLSCPGSHQDLIGWVRSRSQEQTSTFTGTAFVIGPGEADIVLEV